jgi:hypothetical protein
MSRIRHISTVVGVAAALLAPAALAERPDDRPGLHGPGAQAHVEAVSVRPDDRPGIRGPGAAATLILAEPDSGFDWADAGIGALGALGLALALLGAVQSASKARRRHAAA